MHKWKLSDLRDAAAILKNRKVSDSVRMLVIPASREVYRRALDEGLIEIFVDAGALVCNPCCGPASEDTLDWSDQGGEPLNLKQELQGRQGSPEAEVYLSSAAVAAASAVNGSITHPGSLK